MTAIAALVEQHRHDDHRPGNRHLPEGRDADHRQGVIDDPEEQRAAQAASTRPLPPMVLIPPITQAATTWSSKPLATST